MKLPDLKKINHVELPEPHKTLIIEPLDYNNPYDFKSMHRHDYFEIIFVKEGQGTQLIDFNSHPMNAGDIFIIYPGQVHLMNRNTTNGILIQFRKDIFEYLHPIRHSQFYTASLIKTQTTLFDHLYDIAARMNALLKTPQLSSISIHKAYSYLQIILISIIETVSDKLKNDKEHHILEEYLSLVTTQIHTKKKVAEYGELLNCPPDKLNEICKRILGKTALELIHEELILEIRRLLLLNDLSLKEMAFHLNFDSQANFSSFIKTKTGMNPTALQKTVLEIYN
jgi:AraC family transcriptional regulator, transcriptional activator of pobA